MGVDAKETHEAWSIAKDLIEDFERENAVCAVRQTPPLAGHLVARERIEPRQVGETYEHGPSCGL